MSKQNIYKFQFLDKNLKYKKSPVLFYQKISKSPQKNSKSLQKTAIKKTLPTESVFSFNMLIFFRQEFLQTTQNSAFYKKLVMEKSNSVKAHNHIILVGSFDYLIIANRTSRLSNYSYARFVRTLNIVSKREESV